MNYRLEEAFRNKKHKYDQYCEGRTIPLIYEYNGKIYDKSLDLLSKTIPDFDPATLQRKLFTIIAQTNNKAKDLHCRLERE